MTNAPHFTSKPAIVLSGGGSRGAYEAGVLHYIRTMLPAEASKKLHFSIYSGSSVGAINVAFLAATSHDLAHQGNEIMRLWANIEAKHIYKRGPFTLGKLMLHSTTGIALNLLGMNHLFSRDDQAVHFQGLLNTRPFFHFLLQNINWPMISQNIANGHFESVAIAATNTLTGNIELFVDHHKDLAYKSRFIMNKTRISPRHVMASAALPVLFPSVAINNIFYNDGGLRMNTPLTPAVHLGASDLVIIATSSKDPQSTKPAGEIPGLGDLIGTFIYSILQDRVETDEHQLRRVNQILNAFKDHVDPDTYQSICADLRIKPIRSLFFYPSQDITSFVDDELRKSFSSLTSFGSLEKTIIRLLEIDEQSGSNLLSYFLFEPTYIRKLLDLGFEDARSRHDEIMTFIEDL